MTAASMPVVQVAFSTLDPGRTVTWYQDVLGFLPAGQMRGASGPEVAAMMGLPGVSCDMRWLVDSSDFFQLEFFEFHEPVPQPGVRRPDEIGWSLLGLHVAEFDAVLRRLCQTGTPAGPVRGNAPARRVCCCDPEGVWLELRERGPLPRRTVRDAPVTTTFVRAVVPDLERSRRFFSGALGLRDSGASLHDPGDEALWKQRRPPANPACWCRRMTRTDVPLNWCSTPRAQRSRSRPIIGCATRGSSTSPSARGPSLTIRPWSPRSAPVGTRFTTSSRSARPLPATCSTTRASVSNF